MDKLHLPLYLSYPLSVALYALVVGHGTGYAYGSRTTNSRSRYRNGFETERRDATFTFYG